MPSQKKIQTAAIATLAQTAKNAFLADLRGLTANQMNAIRAEAKKHGITTRVTKNTLVKLALQDSAFTTLAPVLKQANVIFFSQNDVSYSAKVLKSICATHDNFTIRHLTFAGAYYPPATFDMLAKLPSRTEALQNLAFTCATPLQAFLNTLASGPRCLSQSLDLITSLMQTPNQ